MPKVLRIINRFNLGGPTYNAAYLAKYLEPEFETMLIGGMKDESEASSEFIVRNLGIEPVIIPQMRRSIHPVKDYAAYRKIRQIIREFQPDIVHTHAAKAGALGRMAANRMNVPVIVHTYHGHVLHSYFGTFKSAIYRFIERKLAKKCARIIAISEKQKKELVDELNICPSEKVSVIPLGFDLSRFRENRESKRNAFRDEYRVKEDEIAIGIIGRLVPVKNHSLFLKAVKYVKEKSAQKIKAFIIGDGELRQKIEREAKGLGLDNSTLLFTSWIKDIDRAYAGLDVVALTSHNEGTPVSLIEAQAAGKAIVSTKAGGTENVVKENETALLSAVGNPDDFSENLLRIVETESLRKKMEQSGWEHVQKQFHYNRLAADTKKLYFSLLNR